MERISNDQFKVLDIKTKGRGIKNPQTESLYTLLNGINTDEMVKISRSEWHLKSTPSSTVSRIFNGRKTFTAFTLTDDSGWVVKRVR